MFSGIVEKTGTISNIIVDQRCKHFTISTTSPFELLTIGESIAINGVCLTVTQFDEKTFQVTAVPETLQQTNLDALVINDTVNLERAILPSTRMGGHYVQGHIDTCIEIVGIKEVDKNALLIEFATPLSHDQYLVKKGYVTIDGMSLTIVDINPRSFSITLIPHTRECTIAKHYAIGTKVNLEVDIMGKYIEKFLGAQNHALKH